MERRIAVIRLACGRCSRVAERIVRMSAEELRELGRRLQERLAAAPAEA